MLQFAGALPVLRSAAVRDLGGRQLDRDRVSAAAVRLIDLGLFRIGGEKYAELDHHYGATTLRKSDVKLVRGGVAFDYIAKEGKRRTITVTDHGVSSTVRALIRSGSDLDPLFVFTDGGAWRPLHSHQVSNYIATRAGGHYTAKEFRTWNATVLMALLLADADPAPTARGTQERDQRRRARGGGLARGHPHGRPQLLHRPADHQPVRGRGRAGDDPEAARRAPGRRRGRGRRRRAAGVRGRRPDAGPADG